MASLHGGFDATTVPESDSFDLIPPGDYQGMVIDSEERQTRSGNGSYIVLTIEITDGQYQGRRVWHNLNLNNPNPKAVAIAQQHLSQACRAVGIHQIMDTAEIHYKPLTVCVKVTPPKDQWEARNDVKGYKPPIVAAQPAAAPPVAPNFNPAAGVQQQQPQQQQPPQQHVAPAPAPAPAAPAAAPTPTPSAAPPWAS